jgi:hypothetical protein
VKAEKKGRISHQKQTLKKLLNALPFCHSFINAKFDAVEIESNLT